MTGEALRFIHDTLANVGIKYEFGEWTANTVPSPYWIGEFADVEPYDECGQRETTFMLTGTSRGSWVTLVDDFEKIENLFPSVGGRVEKLDNGSAIAVFFDTTTNVPTDTMDIKRMQINLTIKEWKVK